MNTVGQDGADKAQSGVNTGSVVPVPSCGGRYHP
jgi:hypothetical protein